ncbi:MAG TPA: bifunctional 3-(3-hydroxy-phenyl)propionate/3-hydroxycinnamic acid hydroxylase [Acidimicrobiales bacterium]|nr:bifunctional 3-(3-hydroxy-phenyl)propionate/3-hydroxycinnamic acid hydroxylase [Acidimicrobiales bacterium]
MTRGAAPPDRRPGTQVDVAIVGAGPVGLLLAILLGQRGWRVQVVERHPHPYDLPRAVHMDDETARVLQGAGVMEALRGLCEPMDAYEWRNAKGEVLLALSGGTGTAGWPSSLMFCQADLQNALLQRAKMCHTVELLWDWELYSLDAGNGAKGSDLSVNIASGNPFVRTVNAKWVVGCDGANSSVRRLTDTSVEDLGLSHRWVVADFLTPGQPRWAPLNLQICDPARPTTAVSGGRGRRRFEFLCLPDEDLAAMATPETVWDLAKQWGLPASGSVLERVAGYRFCAQVAKKWRAGPGGRVLLAGDAAHQMPPFAGQGLCAGVRDVANLAWKLDLVLAGRAGEDLLDTYEAERAPLAREEVGLSVALGQIVCVTDSAAAAERDAAMVPVATESGPIPIPEQPSLPPVLANSGFAHAGRVGIQAPVGRNGDGVGMADDVLGGLRWALLSPHGNPCDYLPPQLRSWWEVLGGAGAQIAPGADLDDTTGAYAQWFSELVSAVVLVRPDYRLYGAVAGLGDTPKLVEALRGALDKASLP